MFPDSKTLEEIERLVKASVAPVRLPIPTKDSTQAAFVINGEVSTFEVPADPRAHTVSRLGDLIRIANRFNERPPVDEAPPVGRPVVWFHDEAVVLNIDDEGHRAHRVTFPLQYSDSFRRLMGLAKSGEWFEQKPFIRLLRIDLAGALDSPVLVDRIRKLTFTSGATVNAVAKRDQESLGHSVNRSVAAEGDLPEDVILNVPVYQNPGERDRLPIRCALELDMARNTFQLVPFPDELERARTNALESIETRLSEGLNEGIHYYYGKI